MSESPSLQPASNETPECSWLSWTQALSLQERTALGFTEQHVDFELSEKYLARWAQAFAKGDHAALQRRLHWDGLSPNLVAQALNPSLDGSGPVPPWLRLLTRFLAELEAGAAPATLLLPHRFKQAGHPFPELWWPWAQAWSNRQHDCALTPAAREDLTVELHAELSRLGADACYQRFQQMRAAPEGSTQYRRFVRSISSGAWRELLQTHTLLARQLGTQLQVMTDEIDRLVAAVTQDAERLQEKFGLSADAKISQIVALGDPHQGGARVRKVVFSDQRCLIFKPRDCTLEARWNDLLAALNSASMVPGLPKLPNLTYVLCAEHAWFEFVPAQPSHSAEKVAERFTQLGALAALSTLTRARDLHQENLIIGPDGPVLIDCETILQPEGAPFAGAPVQGAHVSGAPNNTMGHNTMALAAAALEASCLATGFVRFPAEDSSGQRYDESALQGLPRASRRSAWSELGSDRLQPGERVLQAAIASNRIADASGLLCEPAHYLEQLCDGFSKAYALLQNAAQHASVLGAIEALANTKLRVVLRPSRQYQAVLDALIGERVQRNGSQATLVIDTMHRAWAAAERAPPLWPLTRAEASALLRGDVPVLHVASADTALASEGVVITGAWQLSPFEALKRRLGAMSSSHLARELQWLRTGLSAGLADAQNASVVAADANPPTQQVFDPLPAAAALNASALRLLISDLAAQLLAMAHGGSDDELTWLAPAHLNPNQRSGKGVSHYLYDGSLGIAWFLAAAGRVLQRPDLSAAARKASAPVRRFLRDPAAAILVAREPWGIGHGLGSLVAGLTALAVELDDPQYFSEAERALALLNARDPDQCTHADLEGGLAGALLAVVRLIEATGARHWLRSARPLVRRLRELKFPHAGWHGHDGHPRSGFMHGQSGIAYALRAYASISLDAAAQASAEAGFAYEDQNFDPTRSGWSLRLDQPPAAQVDMSHTWCNGIAGILPARFAYARQPAGAERERLELAALRLYQQVPAGVDHLCCGNLGRAVALADLGRQLNRPEAHARASAWLAAVVQAAEVRGRYLLREDAQQNLAAQPGLFRGLAGIGMAALSLGWPERMGSVLSFKAGSR